jgi:futalosine hydrolase
MPNLILVPTPLERNLVQRELNLPPDEWTLQLCGFGLVAAAATTTRWLHQLQPDRLMLIGIAGTYDPTCYPIGTALRCTEASCDGIGVGVGEHYRSAEQMGWNQVDPSVAGVSIGQTIPLAAPAGEATAAAPMLSVCAASSNPDEADLRRKRYPNAIAEEMEGYAVALAATLAGAPLQIVRGISNLAGDRDFQRWKIKEAIAAACKLASELANRPWGPLP